MIPLAKPFDAYNSLNSLRSNPYPSFNSNQNGIIINVDIVIASNDDTVMIVDVFYLLLLQIIYRK